MRRSRGLKLYVICGIAFVIYTGARLLLAAQSEPEKPTIDLTVYGHVVQVGWVVKDLDAVVDHWERLGISNIRRVGVQEFPDVNYRGQKTPLSMKMAFANVGGVQIEWIQPVKGRSVYDEFLETYGDGVHHLAFGVRGPEQFEEQIRYFKAKGVDVIQRGSWQGSRGKGLFAYLDTAEKGGGLTLELAYNPDAPPAGTVTQSHHDYPFNRIVQYAMVVHDVEKVGAFYESLGFGAMPVDQNKLLNLKYRGQPGKFEMKLGWWRWGDVPFEWIEPVVGPSVYHDFLKDRGEGFHHLAFNVSDMDEALEMLAAKGAPETQSGAWDFPSSKGRFAYIDTERRGGVSTELLWNQPRGQ